MKPASLSGVYAITPDDPDPEQLLARVTLLLYQGIDLLQLRVKQLAPRARLAAAAALQARCAAAGVPLIINDDIALAENVGAAGVHLGRDDGDPAQARAKLGAQAIIGISSYATLERARAWAGVVDYVAFGSVFGSPTKPQAPRAPLTLFAQARALGCATVAIGGITPENAARVIQAGADAVAVISAIFAAADPAAATRALHQSVHTALAQRARCPEPPAL